MLKEMLDHVREKCPLIHNITNYVTVNDCANILLACGGSPIMADDAEEAEEITAICGGLNINIGTLNQRTIPAMHLAGKKANELGHPVVLDPWGRCIQAADKYRQGTAGGYPFYGSAWEYLRNQDTGSGDRRRKGRRCGYRGQGDEGKSAADGCICKEICAGNGCGDCHYGRD